MPYANVNLNLSEHTRRSLMSGRATKIPQTELTSGTVPTWLSINQIKKVENARRGTTIKLSPRQIKHMAKSGSGAWDVFSKITEGIGKVASAVAPIAVPLIQSKLGGSVGGKRKKKAAGRTVIASKPAIQKSPFAMKYGLNNSSEMSPGEAMLGQGLLDNLISFISSKLGGSAAPEGSQFSPLAGKLDILAPNTSLERRNALAVLRGARRKPAGGAGLYL